MSDSNQLVQHLRMIHFSIIVVCVGLLIVASQDVQTRAGKAHEDLLAIARLGGYEISEYWEEYINEESTFAKLKLNSKINASLRDYPDLESRIQESNPKSVSFQNQNKRILSQINFERTILLSDENGNERTTYLMGHSGPNDPFDLQKQKYEKLEFPFAIHRLESFIEVLSVFKSVGKMYVAYPKDEVKIVAYRTYMEKGFARRTGGKGGLKNFIPLSFSLKFTTENDSIEEVSSKCKEQLFQNNPIEGYGSVRNFNALLNSPSKEPDWYNYDITKNDVVYKGVQKLFLFDAADCSLDENLFGIKVIGNDQKKDIPNKEGSTLDYFVPDVFSAPSTEFLIENSGYVLEKDVDFVYYLGRLIGRDIYAGSSFESAFPELDEFTKHLRTTNLLELEKHLEFLSRESRGTLELFGAKLPLQTINQWAPLVLMSLQLYFLMHFFSFKNQADISSRSEWTFPWIALYQEPWVRLVFVLTSCVLPVWVMGQIGFRMFENPNDTGDQFYALGIVNVGILLGVLTFINYMKLLKKRPQTTS